LLATASISISFAPTSNLETTTGASEDIFDALDKYLRSSSLFFATDIAAPDNTKEGRINTGNQTLFEKSSASFTDANAFQYG